MIQKPPSKKTKGELLEEYRRLQEQYEELQTTAKTVHDPKSVELVEKANGYSADTVTKSISDLKASINNTLNDIADKLLVEAERFTELQKAIALSKSQLELNYNIQVSRRRTLSYLGRTALPTQTVRIEPTSSMSFEGLGTT